MRTLTVRNVPDDVYDALQDLAKRNRRSLQQEVIVFLERARLLRGTSPITRARQIRARLAKMEHCGERSFGDVVQDIREDRER